MKDPARHQFEHIEILHAEESEADAEMTMRALQRDNRANHLVRVKDGAEAPGCYWLLVNLLPGSLAGLRHRGASG